MDSHGGQRFLVERIRNHVKGRRTSYLVRWRGYPPLHDGWEPRAQLIVDVKGLLRQYDEAHPMDQKVHRKTRAPGDCKSIGKCQSLHAYQ